jgi:hypothetical protein
MALSDLHMTASTQVSHSIGVHASLPSTTAAMTTDLLVQGHMMVGEAEQEMLEAGFANAAPVARVRRKKPSAPNPLSVKRKVEKSEQASGSNRRKRKHSRPKDAVT